MSIKQSKSDRKDLQTRAFFGVLTLLIAAGLLAVRHVTITNIADAENWKKVPCRIERSEFKSGDEGSRYLVIEYRYEIDGVSYLGDQLDLSPGSTGDESAWEEQLHEANPPGGSSFCYVDPERPERSVLDRRHGADNPRVLLLLSMPFLAIAIVFLFSVAWTLTNLVASKTAADIALSGLPEPPRRLSLSQRLALLQGSSTSLMAWAFLIGFVVVFRLMDGPAHLRDYAASNDTVVDGRVTAINPADQREFGETVYEYSFEFDHNGQEIVGTSFIRGKRYEEGDSVRVALDPAHPEQATIENARHHAVPIWVVMIPTAVIVLLILGIIASHLASLRILGLARNGQLAKATLVEAGRADVANPLTQHDFVVNGTTYQVDPRSSLPPTLKECLVLYDPGKPRRNHGLTPQQAAVIAGQPIPWARTILSSIVPLLGTAAIIAILRI